MAEIKSGDKVKLNKNLSYKKISMKNGEVENESVESWDEGTEHTVKAVIGELFVVLESISSMVPISYVEKVEEYYTGKVVCVKWPNNLFIKGKVYEIKNGIVTCENGTDVSFRVRDLYLINSAPGVLFIGVKNPEALEEKTYYNGKVICICNLGEDGFWTPGKIYKYDNGETICDNGIHSPMSGGKIESYDDLCKRYGLMFIEIEE